MDIYQQIYKLKTKDTLNKSLWKDDNTLFDDVKLSFLKSAMNFIEFIGIKVDIRKIIFTGSNASYNFNDWSDCDIHVVVDYHDKNYLSELLLTKKTLWNILHHDVKAKGYNIEIYPEDVNQPVTASGIYDLLHNKWLKKPSKQVFDNNDSVVNNKVEALIDEIESVIKTHNYEQISKTLQNIRELRQRGLDKSGEQSVENLTFKVLRNGGYIEKLIDAKAKIENKILSTSDKNICSICEAPEGGLHRCTAVTINSIARFFHIQEIRNAGIVPVYNTQVIEYLQKRGLQLIPVKIPQNINVMNFINTHRRGVYYISTDGHAMSLINGELFDAENKGGDNRKVLSAFQIER